jgi:Outer membrane protein beta-barrel family/TonB-dependent Receptor Plug Domain
MRALVLAGVAITALTAGTPALATQSAPAGKPAAVPTPGSRTTVYDAAFFAQYAPRTALDIAKRVPGFTLDLGATQTNQGTVDVRGFAGTAGNVVINGARPSSKAETLDVTLARIPAQQVLRVEVGPGDLYGSDYSGKSQVLNIVMSAKSGVDANVTASARRLYTGYVLGDILGSALIQKGASTINLSAGTGRNRQLQEGPDTFTDVRTGQVLERRRKFNSYFNKNPYLSASWALERGPDSAFRLNARWQPSRFDLFQNNRVSPTAGPQHDDNLFQHYRDPVIELGGDVTRPLAGGAIKLVGLATRRKRHDFDSLVRRNGLLKDDATVNGGFEQLIDARRNETIGRLSWNRADLAGFSFEAGAEGAFNTLDDRVDFFGIDENGERVPIDLSIANATVNEKRGEVYISAGRTLSRTLRIDGGVNYEFSTLKVRGDAIADRSLKFLKPNLTVDWKPGHGWHSQASIRRTVAQLDFYDFISAANLSTNQVNGGNENLQPQRSWEFHLTAEHPLLGDGLFKLDVGHDVISLLQDRILIDDGHGHSFDAPGNVGTGKRDFASLTLDAPLGRWWDGLRAKFTGTVRRTRVADPIDGKIRQFSGYFPNWEWNLDVRRDHGPFSYGFVLSDNQHFTFFRTDGSDANFNGGVYGTAFVEYRPSARTSIALDANNLFNTTTALDRLIYDPNRAAPKQVFNELRVRNNHLDFGLTLKQSFGGSGGVAK